MKGLFFRSQESDSTEIFKRAPAAKRGKLSGRKQVYRTDDGGHHIALAAREMSPAGSALLEPLIRDGEIVREFDLDDAIERARTDVDRTGFPGTDE